MGTLRARTKEWGHLGHLSCTPQDIKGRDRLVWDTACISLLTYYLNLRIPASIFPLKVKWEEMTK